MVLHNQGAPLYPSVAHLEEPDWPLFIGLHQELWFSPHGP